MQTNLEQWQEWLARCAVGRCSAATAVALRRFGAHRFRHYLARCLGPRFAEGAVPEDAACFHLFETHCCVSRARTGKRYKDWIAGRGSGAADTARFESGASLLLRDVVREFVRREGPAAGEVSIDAVLEGTEGLTLADLLPDESMREQADADCAEAIARACLRRLLEKHCVAVLARRLGVPLSDPAVLLLTGVQKSRTARLWAEVYEMLADETRRQLPDGDRGSWLQTALHAAEWLGNHLFLKERLEKRWRVCFKEVEGLYE